MHPSTSLIPCHHLPCLFCLSGNTGPDFDDTEDEICDTVTRLPVDEDTEPVCADGCR